MSSKLFSITPNQRIFQEIWSLIDDRAVLHLFQPSVNLFTAAIKFTSTEIHRSSIYHVCNRDAFIVCTHPVVLPYLSAVRTRPFMLLAQFCYLTLSKPETTCMCRSISCTSIFIRSLASSQIHWPCLWRYTCTQKSEQCIYCIYIGRGGGWSTPKWFDFPNKNYQVLQFLRNNTSLCFKWFCNSAPRYL